MLALMLILAANAALTTDSSFVRLNGAPRVEGGGTGRQRRPGAQIIIQPRYPIHSEDQRGWLMRLTSYRFWHTRKCRRPLPPNFSATAIGYTLDTAPEPCKPFVWKPGILS